MKFFITALLLLSCTNFKNKPNSYIILECDLETDKPFPVLIFGTSQYSEKIEDSRDFIVSEEDFQKLNNCVINYFETSNSKKNPAFQATLIFSDNKKKLYVYNVVQVRLFFNSLNRVLTNKNLLSAVEEVNLILTRLNGY